MRIFKESESRHESTAPARENSKNTKRRNKAESTKLKTANLFENNPQIIKREKPVKEFSDREIREKLSAHLDKSNSATTMNKIKKEEMLGSGFLDEDVVAKKIALQKSKEQEALNKADLLVKPIEEATESKTTISVEKIQKPSDVGLNNPKDPMTSSKLKSALDMGAFSFNPKEREVLSKILEERV